MKTKQDFQAVAEIISLIPRGAKRNLAILKANGMFKDNPRFDSKQFQQAINGPDKKEWLDVDKELEKISDVQQEFGKELSHRIHDRLRGLFIKLSKFKDVKINHLIMGMGGWAIDGTVPWEEEFKGKIHTGTHDISTEDFTNSQGCWQECYERVNPGICAVVAEMEKLLQVLTAEKYLELIDINDAEMKKLLKKD